MPTALKILRPTALLFAWQSHSLMDQLHGTEWCSHRQPGYYSLSLLDCGKGSTISMATLDKEIGAKMYPFP